MICGEVWEGRAVFGDDGGVKGLGRCGGRGRQRRQCQDANAQRWICTHGVSYVPLYAPVSTCFVPMTVPAQPRNGPEQTTDFD